MAADGDGQKRADVAVEVDGKAIALTGGEADARLAAIGAAFVGEQAGASDIVTYDGASLAIFRDGRAEWPVGGIVGDLPAGVPVVELETVESLRMRDLGRYVLVAIGGDGPRVAEQLRISRVMVVAHPHLMASLGRVVSPAVADAAKDVLELGELLDDSRLPAEFGYLSGLTSDRIPTHLSSATQALATVRFGGDSRALIVPVTAPTVENIEQSFTAAYRSRHGGVPADRRLEVVRLHVRRMGIRPRVRLADAFLGPALSDE